MSRSLKICPLCKKTLVVRYPTVTGDIVRYICSTHIPGSKLSHYYIEAGNNSIEVIHVPPYSLINNLGTDTTDVYPLNINSIGGITQQKKIVSLPRFPLGDPAKLPDRIKIFVLFS